MVRTINVLRVLLHLQFISRHLIVNNMLYIQEQPLDLSLKNQNIKSEPDTNANIYNNHNFDFNEFYRNYLAISVRSWNVYQPRLQPQYPQYGHSLYPVPSSQPPTNSSVKRKLSNEFDEVAKKVKIETHSCQNSNKHNTSVNKMIKRRRKEEISLIQKSCDCKSCYEDHINKLRIKSDPSSWTLL